MIEPNNERNARAELALDELLRMSSASKVDSGTRPSVDVIEAYVLGFATPDQVDEVLSALASSRSFRQDLAELMQDAEDLSVSQVEIAEISLDDEGASSSKASDQIRRLLRGFKNAGAKVLVGAGGSGGQTTWDESREVGWEVAAAASLRGEELQCRIPGGRRFSLSFNPENDRLSFQIDPQGSQRGHSISLSTGQAVDRERMYDENAPGKIELTMDRLRNTRSLSLVGPGAKRDLLSSEEVRSIRNRLPAYLQLEEKIDEGGFATTYKVRNERLNCFWAVKDLFRGTEELSVGQRSKLLNEARVLARVRHPNVVAVHHVEPDSGLIMMEFVDGKNLLEKCDRGAATWEEFVSLSNGILSGVAAAHDNNVIHGDLSPFNILLESDGTPRLVDFGFAQHIDFADTSNRGTEGYSAPEVLNKGVHSTRSDVFSLGIILFQLATGSHPFTFNDLTTYREAISSQIPRNVKIKLRSPHEGLLSFLGKALAREPMNRFASASEMKEAFKALTSAALGSTETRASQKPKRGLGGAGLGIIGLAILLTAAGILWKAFSDNAVQGRPRIAVLPFSSSVPNDTSQFAAGLTAEITTRLGSVPGLTVIDRRSAAFYEGRQLSTKEIGHELNVDYLLSGEIFWESTPSTHRLRIVPMLVLVSDGSELWSKAFNVNFAGFFDTQEEIAARVTEEMGIALGVGKTSEAGLTQTTNPLAAEYFLRAVGYYYQGDSKEDLGPAIHLYRKAIAEDPEFGAAHARLSRVFSKMVHWRISDIPGLGDSAQAYLSNALRLDPDSYETNLAMGDLLYRIDRDYSAALVEYGAALHENPNSADVHASLGYVYRRMGEADKSLKHLEKALELDPKNTELILELGNTNYKLRQWEAGRSYLQRAIDLRPDVYDSYRYLAELEMYAHGDFEKASAILDQAALNCDRSEVIHEQVWLSRFGGNSSVVLAKLENAGIDGIDAHLYRAQLLSHLKLDKEALVYYDSAYTLLENEIKSEPSDPELRLSSALILSGRGQHELALQECERALSLYSDRPNPDNFNLGPRILKSFAEACALAGQPDEACEHLDAASRMPFGLVTRSFLNLNPALASIRNSARYGKLINSLP